MKQRNQSLDVLRGIALILVLGRHFPHAWFSIGWMGVDLFFVLSGFLVSGLLFRDYQVLGKIRLGRFLVRRCWKIWPSFFAYIGFVTMLSFLLHAKSAGHPLTSAVLFVYNYSPGSGLESILSHVWSLAVEEHFYLLLPVVLLFLLRLAPNKTFISIPYISGSLLLLCAVGRYFSHSPNAMFQSHLRFDGLFAGVTLGYWFNFRPEIFRKLNCRWNPWMCLVSIVAVGLLGDPLKSRLTLSVGVMLLAIGFCSLVVWSVEREPWKLLWPVARIGLYSYSIYLWHLIAAICILALGNHWWSLPAYLLTALIFGISASKLIEMRALRLRDSIDSRQVMIDMTRQLATAGTVPLESHN